MDLTRSKQLELDCDHSAQRSQKTDCVDRSSVIDIQVVWSSCCEELLSLCMAYGYDRSTSEDICQEAFLSAWEKMPSINHEAEARRWLFRTTINRCHQEYRSRKRRSASLRSLKDWFALLKPNTDENELHSVLRSELEQLEHRERTVLILTYYQHKSSAEIAAIFGVPSSTIRTWLQTGRNRLAKRIVHLLEED